MTTRRVVGLDLGTNSVGWALLEERDGKLARVIQAGVRVFDQSVDGSIEDGKDEPLAVGRRQARQVRRQLDRRTMRRINTLRCLQQHGMLPEGPTKRGAERQALINGLDVRLAASMARAGHDKGGLNQLPYFLRAIALDVELPPQAFGRAIYHLSQRRGFKSNRKDASREDSESGTVKPAIQGLVKDIAAAGKRTLGEYFHSLDPHQHRIRKRWTGRDMYVHEFHAMWDAQQRFNPKAYPESLRNELADHLFSQRALKSQKGLIGRCELEPQRRRASFATIAAQRFRYIQRINDLRYKPTGADEYTDLTPAQREALYAAMESDDHLDQNHNLSFAKMKTILGLKGKQWQFNLQEGGEKHIPGNKSAGRIRKAIGGRWDQYSEQDKKDLIGLLMGGASDERLHEILAGRWGLDEVQARALSQVGLEDSYCAYSTRALNRLLPLMEQGTPFATAKLEIYGDTINSDVAAFDFLPPLEGFVDLQTGEISESLRRHRVLTIRNPVVHRVLSQTRQVLNHIIKAHGKPDMIRLELARDIKKPREVRKNIAKINRDLQKERDVARAYLTANFGMANPKRSDVDKYMLWKECEETCPYTGNRISAHAVFGENAQYDIEHIIPFSRCLDNSYMNKTLCYHEENRNVKRNKTPFEAYAGNADSFEAMLTRVRAFKGERGQAKLGRFKMEDLKSFEEFTSRHLNDTRYAAKEAKRYLSLLYGGESHRRIQVSTGQLTSELRKAWQMNAILNDGGTKTREDHRHHAVDAIVIACISPGMTKAMADACKRCIQERGRERGWWKLMAPPWEGFEADCRAAIEGITVSHRYSRKVRGGLHEGTNYSPQRTHIVNGKEKPCVHIRRPLDESFTVKDVESIVDPAVREAVRGHLERFGGKSKEAFADPTGRPQINGIPIHRVRTRKYSTVSTIGAGENERHVLLGNNHHVEVVARKDKKGNTKWDFVIVDLLTAMQRVKNGQPVVNRDHGEGTEFIMSLCKGDSLIMEDTEGAERPYIVRKFDKNGIMFFKEPNDARLAKDIPAVGNSRRAGSFQRSNPRKVTITPLGQTYPCND